MSETQVPVIAYVITVIINWFPYQSHSSCLSHSLSSRKYSVSFHQDTRKSKHLCPEDFPVLESSTKQRYFNEVFYNRDSFRKCRINVSLHKKKEEKKKTKVKNYTYIFVKQHNIHSRYSRDPCDFLYKK